MAMRNHILHLSQNVRSYHEGLDLTTLLALEQPRIRMLRAQQLTENLMGPFSPDVTECLVASLVEYVAPNADQVVKLAFVRHKSLRSGSLSD